MTGTVKISRRVLIFTVLTAAALAAAVLGLLLGSAWLDFGQVWNGLWGGDANTTESLILHTVRLPRVAAGLLAGAGLALSGALLQAATGNALAGPSIIGVNAGAGFAMILCLCFFPCPTRHCLWLPFWEPSPALCSSSSLPEKWAAPR